MASLLDLLPLQLKTLAESALPEGYGGNRSPITENTISNEDKQKVANAILASRTYKQSLLDLKQDNALKDWQQKEYNKYFPSQEAISRFKSGAGSVGYDDYYNAGQSANDWNIFPSGSVRNTLGQFTYSTDKNGNIVVKDKYDFYGDMIEGLPKSVANTDRYKDMGAHKKAWTVAKETVYMPEVGFDPILGLRSVPSRYGNAFVGKTGRDVNITLPPTYQINPTEEDLYKTRIDLMK